MRPWAYYNEWDPKIAAWLRELIKAGLIADGEVDTRSITDVRADDVRGFVQCHFFAGIGGWSYALRLAGWPDDREVWTGSCPCQPFSSAGKGASAEDSRHLWPTWFELIRQCKPSVVFGEQVASADGLAWVDLVHDDLEGEDYAVGAVDLGAPCVGAFDIRQRLWFVADAKRGASERQRHDVAGATSGTQGQARQRERVWSESRTSESVGSLANAEHAERRSLHVGREDGRHWSDSGWPKAYGQSGTRGEVREFGDTDVSGLAQRDSGGGAHPGTLGPSAREASERTGEASGFWSDAEWIPCTDGKWRPIEPGSFPLAHVLPAGMGRLSAEQLRLAELAGLDGKSLMRAKAYRVMALHGYGNAIKPELAAEFIGAYMDICAEPLKERRA